MRRLQYLAAALCVCGASVFADTTLVVSEIQYHPRDGDARLEWIELENELAVDLDISGWYFADGIDWVFPEGTVVAGGGFVVVAADPLALAEASGFGGALGPFVGRLDDSGERLELRDRNGRLLDAVRYNDRSEWPVPPDGSGATLAKIRPGLASDDAASWTWSPRAGGTPGAPNFPRLAAGPRRPEGVVSYWSFDEEDGSAVDLFGSNSGTLGAAVARVPGLAGSGALDFDDSSDAYVDVGPGDGGNFSVTSGITLEALIISRWSGAPGDDDHIFRKQDGTRRIVFAFQNDDVADDRDIPIDPAAQPVLAFGINVGGSYRELDMPLDGKDGRPRLEDIADGKPHHVAATYDGASGVKTIWFDGAPVFTVTLEAGAEIQSGGPSTAYIGNMAGRRGPFAGTLDEVAFWSRALSAAEVAEHHARALEGRSWFDPDDDEVESDAPGVIFSEAAIEGDSSFLELWLPPGALGLSLAGVELWSPVPAGVVRVFRFDPQSRIEPGERVAISNESLGWTPVAGDKVFLTLDDGERILDGLAVRAGNSALEDGLLDGRKRRWLAPAVATPGEKNRFALEDRVVLSEILYHQKPVLAAPAELEERILVPIDAEWRYDASGSDLGSRWREPGFDDSSWPVGKALFYEERSDLPAAKNTPIPLGPITYYFRREVELQVDPAKVRVEIEPLVDDGVVVWLNGVEVLRVFMPEGPIDATTLAARTVGNARFSGPYEVPPSALRPGRNVLAVEVHQSREDSDDIVFGLEAVEIETIVPETFYEESPEAWIELYNRGGESVDLSGWELDGGVRYAFEAGTMLAPNEYLIVAEDEDLVRTLHPEAHVVGNLDGRLSNRSDRLLLLDAFGNPADEVIYHDGGRWPAFADGYGASLELRDPRADNASPEAWAASDEGSRSVWREYRYGGTAASTPGPTRWNELVLGLLEAGEVLIDDLHVIEEPRGEGIELLQNGDFESGAASWRFLGTHAESQVELDPGDPTNHVLHLVATGPTEHMHNHIETTLAANARVRLGADYEISFRAKWLGGSRQLNTRLYFNRLARTTVLDSPVGSGTPGRANSRSEENIGPTFRDFAHAPVVPRPGEEVAVSVRIDDPDGVARSTLWWAVDRRAAVSTPMELAADGTWRGVIPGSDVASAVVQFWVEAEDGSGAAAMFPPKGPASGAIFAPADDRGGSTGAHEFRILITTATDQRLFEVTAMMSNASHPGTVIYDGADVYYDVGVRLRGSERGRPDASRTSYHVNFDPSHLFRGVHDNVSIDRSGGWASQVPFGSQDEILVKHIVQKAGGIPGMYDDIVHLVAPRRQHDGSALLLLAKYSSEYLDTQFENGSDGTKFTYELIYYPTTTTNGNPESLKRPLPDEVTGTDHTNLGDDKEIYRWFYLIENNADRDDYSAIIRFAKTMALSGAALDAASQEVMDVDQWMRAFAMYSLAGIGDTYMSGNFHNNVYWVRPSDGRVLIFPWDMDFAFVNSPSAALWGSHNLRKVIEIPHNTRAFYGHLLDIVDRSFNAAYMDRWIAHYGAIAGQNFSGFSRYIDDRRRFVLGRIPPVVPLEVTTNGGEDFETDDEQVVVEGTAWFDVRSLVVLVGGEPVDLDLGWSTPTRWRATVPVAPGRNEISFAGFNDAGALLGQASLAVTRASSGPVFLRGDATRDGAVDLLDAVAILRHLFHGAGPIDCPDAADANDDGRVDVADPVAVLRYIFQRGPELPPPFPGAGPDPTPDGLSCETP